MIDLRRVSAVSAFVSLAAVITCTHVWGDPKRDKHDADLRDFRAHGDKPGAKIDRAFEAQFDFNRFADQPLVVYQTATGDTLAALQLKPDLEAVPARPRDVLILIDTSASKAQGPLASAIKLAETLSRKLGKDDRVSIMTVNTSAKSLTNKRFVPATELAAAFKALANEFPAGAVNLKQGLPEAINSFENIGERQRVLVFLGDGKSLAGPVDADDRAKIAEDMIQRQIAFYAVPLGPRPDAVNIHGFVNSTGGKVVRLLNESKVEETAAGLLTAFAAPILYPDQKKLQLPAFVVEYMPTKLPPLRGDVATLLLCKVEKPAARFEYAITGIVAGQKVTAKMGLAMPKPEVDNFFLASMYKQWRDRKDRPAMMQADRALAFASDQNQMARLDLIEKARWALDQNQFDPAWRLFKEAEALDPNCKEAKVGIDLVEKLKNGKIDRAQIRKEFEPNEKDMLVRFQNGKVGPAERGADAVNKDKADPLAGVDGPGDPLKEAAQRRAIADQQHKRLVDDAIAEAQRLVKTQPNKAHDFLKNTLNGVQTNPDISEAARIAMSDRLERTMQSVDREGAGVARSQAERLQLEAFALRKLQADQSKLGQEAVLRDKLQTFHKLMDEGRAQQAFIQATQLREKLVYEGQSVPQSVVAAERTTLAKYHLKELRDMVRLREERFLAVLLEVERSHVPFPDEPPVEFPNAAKLRQMTRGIYSDWSEFSKYRAGRYSSMGFGPEMPAKALELKTKLSEVRKFKGFDDPKTTLQEALELLMRSQDISIDVNERAFRSAKDDLRDVMKFQIVENNAIPEFTGTLATMLKKICARLPNNSGATYIIRRDTIEITTGYFAGMEKTIRVYPVADLVIPIATPGQFAQQQQLNQSGLLGIAGQFGQLGQIGQLGLVGQFGQFGNIGAIGGNIGAIGGNIGAIGGNLGAIGGNLGAIGGNLGAIGGNLGAIGGNLGAVGGNLGAVGGNLGAIGGNLGAIGGNIGAIGLQFGQGGQLGQLGQAAQLGQQGQLGQLAQIGQAGQLGLQNNGQEKLLITLITQVVGKPSDWRPQFDPITGRPTNQLATEDDPLAEEKNQLGYYPPALGLVVKGSSRIHSSASAPSISGAVGGGMGYREYQERRKLDPKYKPQDPKVVWQEALTKGVDEPGLIIACADYLALNQEWGHAAEFLKANLRQGIIVEPWVYEALAIALRESGGSPEEIERAEVSAADLRPLDAQGLLRASQAMAGQKRYNQAVAFCRQASALQPNLVTPFTEALQYAELADDAKSMEWAAGNLLKQDWPTNNRDIQARAAQKVDALAKKLEAKLDGKDDARRLTAAVAVQRRRDLVIKMSWQGDASLDLKVTEPGGSVCWVLNRQSIGGGVLIGGNLTELTDREKMQTYQAAQAFSGEYAIDVHRVWGKPEFDTAQLRIIIHQGTKSEHEQMVTVDLRNPKPVKFRLDAGRRTEAASVPPPSAQQQVEDNLAETSSDRVLAQLRTLSSPQVTSFERASNRGGSVGGTPLDHGPMKPSNNKNDQVLYQTKVSSFVKDSMDLTAQAVLAADRRSVRVTVAPVYTPSSNQPPTAPAVNNPLLPGAP